LYGGDGGDYFYAYPGSFSPSAFGEAGNDIYVDLSGGLGTNDSFYGGDGQDYFYGYGGDDVFYGGVGVDVFLGGDGNDYFSGGPGVDYAYGGSGRDTFGIEPGYSGVLVIYDFVHGQDLIDISYLGGVRQTDALIQSELSYYGGINTTIFTIPNTGTAVWFVGVPITSLGPSDFIY
jgi:Ca2+-binding RTX toxin-like protein